MNLFEKFSGRKQKKFYSIWNNSISNNSITNSLFTNSDKDYNLVDMDTSAIMKKKWDGNYYLTMQDNKKEYQLGKTVISYKANVNKLNTYGKMFRIYTDAKIEKIEE